MPIAIDIGVNEDTAPDFVQAGVTKLISGSAIFENPDIKETIKYFRGL
jgi:pentose-5-phosphate-3-epimerase